MKREVVEETGLADCVIIRKIVQYDWVSPETNNTHERQVFHLAASDDTLDNWTWIETSGGTAPESEHYVFVYRWLPLNGPIDLAGHQGDYLDAIR